MDTDSQDSQQPLMELEPPILRNSDRPRTKTRRRRRSSARFLRLTGRLLEEIDEEEEEEEPVESDQNLGDMYKRAIRMNAENRINASNSWNLRLIENIDKFLEEDPVDTESTTSSRSSSPNTVTDENEDLSTHDSVNEKSTSRKNRKNAKEKRVNFTKASCTLDASVKIYSYRVDDVHLTSYKVLANLNRTEDNKANGESSKKNSKQAKDIGSSQTGDEGGVEGATTDEQDKGPSKFSSKSTGTLETNIANINMNKLDSAFDIDPLFHKMSKTFDEGGAKGLLLVNLGVGGKGCNIVFDSKAGCEEEKPRTKNQSGDVSTEDPQNEERREGLVDISSLLAKLDTSVIESLFLVPQLASLREQYAQLEQEGFVEEGGQCTKRYACTQEEENEADMSIHQEAIERSRASQGALGTSSFAASRSYTEDDDNDPPDFAPDDFGAGDHDDGDDEGFDQFVALDKNGARFSSISFQDSVASGLPESQPKEKSQADVLLDVICSGNVLGSKEGDYEYFDTQTLETSMAGNLWAGSAHWKRTEPVRRRRERQENDKKKTKRTKPKKSKNGYFVNLTATPVLEDLLRKPPKGKRGANPLQLSKTIVTKYTKEGNLLPPDSGIGVDKLAGLFLRPNVVVQLPRSNIEDGKPSTGKRKSVCFDSAVETFGVAFDDGSFGGNDDNDGPGFAFADDDDHGLDTDNSDDFIMEELKAVRKVDTKNVQVGYATVAKKVDVRRLKRDLWTEIEFTIIPPKEQDHVEDEEEGPTDEEASTFETPAKTKTLEGLSFQDAVRDMEMSKTQVDVTLPFYFICVLHLANEKGLRLETLGLDDFVIHNDQRSTVPSSY